MQQQALGMLALVFVTSVLAVGRRDGVRCLCALSACGVACVGAARATLLPSVHPLAALLICALVSLLAICFALLSSWRQAVSSALGAGAALIVSGAVSAFCVWQLKLTGVFNTTMRDLWYAMPRDHLGMHYIVLGGMILASVAVVADLAIAVTSTMAAVKDVNPDVSRKALIMSGIRLGGDVTGTEVNTLIFAFLGLNMGAILLPLAPPDVFQAPFPWVDLVNRQAMAVGVVTALAGTLGLTLAIPLTAVIGSVLMHRVPAANTSAGCAHSSPSAAPSTTSFGVIRSRAVVAGSIGLVLLATLACDQWLAGMEYSYPGGKAQILRGTVIDKTPPTGAWETPKTPRRGESLQQLRVRMATSVVLAENIITGSPVNDRIPDIGEEVLLQIRDLGHEKHATMREHARDRWLLRIAGAVSVLMLLVFGRKGGRALLALAVSLAVVMILPPAILAVHGAVLPLTIGAILLVLGSTYLILCGPTRKAVSAIGGALAGIVLSGFLAILAARISGLSGLHDQDLAAIHQFSTARTLDFRALLVAGMLLGTLGVVMDVAIAVASAVSEVVRAAPALSISEIRARGMSVGRKVMGAMVMALALAYAGLNFGLFILPFAQSGSPLADVVGTERVTAEVMRLLVGITAVVWTVPATAWLAAAMAKRKAT